MEAQQFSMESRVRQNSLKMNDAFAARDFKAYASLYSDDCQILPSGAPICHGSKAAGEFWAGMVSDVRHKMTLKIAEMWPQMHDGKQGRYCIERGTCTFNNKQGQVSTQVKYIAMWKEIDGDWKCCIDIWNFDN